MRATGGKRLSPTILLIAPPAHNKTRQLIPAVGFRRLQRQEVSVEVTLAALLRDLSLDCCCSLWVKMPTLSGMAASLYRWCLTGSSHQCWPHVSMGNRFITWGTEKLHLESYILFHICFLFCVFYFSLKFLKRKIVIVINSLVLALNKPQQPPSTAVKSHLNQPSA